MKLSDRKKKILKIVVDDYISTATPISSKQIQQEHLQDVSSATIRNELSSLEDMGFLIQPHVSAGRIPSNSAYRLYVNELMSKQDLSADELDYISSYFGDEVKKVEDIVLSSAKLISEITNYTTVAMAGSKSGEYITDIKLVKITSNQALIIVVIDNDIIKDSVLLSPIEIDLHTVENADMILKKIFVGKSIDNLLMNQQRMEMEFVRFKVFFKHIISILKDYITGKRSDIVFEGQSKILQYPEYNNLEKARQFFEIMDSKKLLISMFGDMHTGGNMELTLTIGNETDENGLPTDCSIVTAKYQIGDKMVGSTGVIGPSRMHYSKVISVLDVVGSIINKIGNNMKIEE